MKFLKVIVATLVIFAAGFVTGSLVLRKPAPAPPQPAPQRAPDAPLPPMLMQQRFLEQRMKRELDLSPEQTARVEKIFAESGENLRILMDLIGPELQAELMDVRDKIRAELRPEQREKFEQLLRQRREGYRGPPLKLDGERDRDRDRDRRKEMK